MGSKNKSCGQQAEPLQQKGSFKKIAIVLIVALVLVNIIWTLVSKKIESETGALRTSLAQIEERMMQLEKSGMTDVSELKTELEAFKAVGTKYDERLSQLLGAEKAKLEALKQQTQAQELWVEALKKAAGK